METAPSILNSTELFGISCFPTLFSKLTVKKLIIFIKNKMIDKIKIIDEIIKKAS